MIDKIKAIKSLLPTAQIASADDVITWVVEPANKPTDAEIEAEVARLQAEHDAKAYARSRAAEYPSIQEQLDMQYWDSINGTTTWTDVIAAVKQQYPKPK